MRIISLSLLAGVLVAVAWAAEPLQVSQTEFIRQMEARRGGWNTLDADSFHSYDQIALALDYQVEDSPANLTGWAYLTLVARENLTQIKINAWPGIVVAVQESGTPVPFTTNSDTVFVQFPLATGDTVTLTFQLSVPPHDSPGEVGFRYAEDHSYTFAEPYGARRWFPCWDQPYDKLNAVTIAVNMPEHWSLAANGPLLDTTYPSPGRKREVYHHDYPISTYLVAFAAGEYARRYETVGGVLYRYITFYEDSVEAVYDWERTPQMTAFFSESFGDYAFGEYGMVQTSIFNGWGAMEHQTMTTYGRNLVNGTRSAEGVVAHELAHMWFGDDLSPVDFRNIWLNEGFATYATALFYQAADSEALFRQIMTNDAWWYFNEDQNYLRYAAYDPPPAYLFGAVEYQKSSWILHMLREQILGDSLFFAVMQYYVESHRAGTVDTEDFIAAVNFVAGAELRWFFDQWIYQAGHPELQIQIQPGVPTARDVTVTVNQTQTNAPIFRFPLLLNVITVEGTVQRQFWFTEQSQSVTETLNADVQTAVLEEFQPLLWEVSAAADDPEPELAQEFALGAVYPNPFNALARIPFELGKAAPVRVEVYDLNGRLVETLTDQIYPAGRHELTFAPGGEIASGIYWISVVSGSHREQVKAVLLK